MTLILGFKFSKLMINIMMFMVNMYVFTNKKVEISFFGTVGDTCCKRISQFEHKIT